MPASSCSARGSMEETPPSALLGKPCRSVVAAVLIADCSVYTHSSFPEAALKLCSCPRASPTTMAADDSKGPDVQLAVSCCLLALGVRPYARGWAGCGMARHSGAYTWPATLLCHSTAPRWDKAVRLPFTAATTTVEAAGLTTGLEKMGAPTEYCHDSLHQYTSLGFVLAIKLNGPVHGEVLENCLQVNSLPL